jgi:uncharacterized delta-60 repeat protein
MFSHKLNLILNRFSFASSMALMLFLLMSANGCSLKNKINGSIGSSESDSSPTPTPTPAISADNFGTLGVVNTHLSSNAALSTDYVRAMKTQADGKILLAGSARTSDAYSFAVVRYNSDGSLDTSFGTGGKVTTDFGTGSNSNAYGIALQSDGKIIVAGGANLTGSDDFGLVRYNTDGSLDTSFGTGGKVRTVFSASNSEHATAIAIQSDGKIIAVGSANTSGSYDFALARYNTDGSLDTGFGTGGKLVIDIGTGSADLPSAVALQGDGKIVAVGETNTANHIDFAMVRCNTNGSLDTSLGTTGIIVTDIGSDTADTAFAVTLQGDGKILVAGKSISTGYPDFALLRYNTNGSLDAGFGTGGKVVTDIGSDTNDIASTMALQGDGKILLAGRYGVGGANPDVAVIRYNANGSLDAGFGTGGKVMTDIGTTSADEGTAMDLQSDGKILVAAQFYSASAGYDFAVLRYGTSGSLDASFGTAGKVTTNIGKSSDDIAYAMALQSDGKVLVAGSYNVSGGGGPRDLGLVRYEADGSLDTSFGSSGKVVMDVASDSNDEAYAVAVQSDGKILLAGTTDAAGSNDFVLVRYNSNGTVDTSFGTSGKVITDIGASSNDYCHAMTIQADGKILLAGTTDSAGSNDFALVRFNTDGSLDTSFGASGKVITDIGASSYDSAAGIALQSDGKILLAGETNSVGSYDFAVIRYNSNGTVDTGFGASGKVVTDIGSSSFDEAFGIDLQSDGKIIVAGSSDTSGSNDFALVRYNANGTLDTSFGASGKAVTDISAGSDDIAKAVALQSDGKIIAAGTSDSGSGYRDHTVVRYNSDGSLDSSFGTSGVVALSMGTDVDADVKAVSVQSDGKIFTAGSSLTFNNSFTVIRFNSDGSK